MTEVRDDTSWWVGNPDAKPPQRYRGAVRQAFYVPMEDGVRLAVDLVQSR
jgi:predicted acyl esterase